MHYSAADKRAAELREEERLALIKHYEAQAALASEISDLAFLNVSGHEVPDPTIIDPPLGYSPQPDLMELMRRMIRNELVTATDALEVETFADADDFDVDDDPVDYSSPYEEYFDPQPGAPSGPPGEVHPARQDPNQEPPKQEATPPAPPAGNAPPAA